MLRKRSRAVTSKQAIVGDQSNLQWLPFEKPTKPISYFFNSPRIFKGFLTISSSNSPYFSSSETQTNNMSPTSILDSKPFSTLANSLWAETQIPPSKPPKNFPPNKHSWDQTKGIGLALVDENQESTNPSTKQKRKLVVFGSQLKIQIPPLPPSSVFPCFSPESPREFGIKTPRSQLWSFGSKDCQVHAINESEMGKKEESFSVSEMEESEDYTCVISHGPNPKTTHIFGNCIVGSCCGNDRSPSTLKRNGCVYSMENPVNSQENFLSFCHHCRKKLGEGKDIFMYRGEKAFCSQECRCQEMLCDGVES